MTVTYIIMQLKAISLTVANKIRLHMKINSLGIY